MPEGSRETAAVRSIHNRVACPMCGEMIIRNARKCNQCASDLGWRRHFSPSAPLLILLSGIASGFSALTIGWHLMTTPSGSSFKMNFINFNFTDGTLHLLVTNDGRATGAIQNVWVIGVIQGRDTIVQTIPGPGTSDVKGETTFELVRKIAPIGLNHEPPKDLSPSADLWCNAMAQFLNSDNSLSILKTRVSQTSCASLARYNRLTFMAAVRHS